MIHYSDIWLGDSLTDWSDISAIGLHPIPEGQEITLHLTTEQVANYAYAQLLVISEMGFADPLYYDIFRTNDINISEDGTLRAKYNYKALYVLDENGNPLSSPIPYKIVEDTYLIRVNLQEKTWAMHVRDILSGNEGRFAQKATLSGGDYECRNSVL